jgi:Asp-tRNA(Asn)/Glu-tRNA(Gln) amidotransferase A subunit family amidase
VSLADEETTSARVDMNEASTEGAGSASPQTPAADAGGPPPIDAERLAVALDVIDLAFERSELELAGRRVASHREAYGRYRAALIPDSLPPAIRFDPWLPGIGRRPRRSGVRELTLPEATRPADLEELAFATIPQLAALIRSRQVSCVELAQLSIERLRRLDAALHCVITLTEQRAITMAQGLDEELAAGRWRGPLHGIPWGAKDLLAVRGHPTTWGTPPFADQVIDEDATVVRRLDAAGAVLIAKLSLGELAWGDVWTGGRTNNPWDPNEGSSGSSAGSAAAVAAGGVPFAIGSETLGSILSPSRICGVTGLRPTFGRVSRHGAMALAWTMDKLGPIARSAEDTALVLVAIAGADGLDETARDVPFELPAPVDPKGWRVGVVEAAFDHEPETRPALDSLRSMGAELVPVTLPKALVDDFWLILEAEAATSFDELTRDGRIRSMVRQEDEAWPNVFRAGRLIPAVEYLRANRIRRRLMIELDDLLQDLDLLVHPTDEDSTLSLENLTGHPAIALPWGTRPNGAPNSIAFAGHLDREDDLVAFAMAWQARTDDHRHHPDL